MKRREFFKSTLKGAAAIATASAVPLEAGAVKKFHITDKTVGILYDATLCIGCNACVAGCKKANSDPQVIFNGQKAWDKPYDLSADTRNIIRKYQDGTAETKNVEKDGYSFIKGQCLHCIEPGCVSACPTSALLKDGLTGIVKYDKDDCIGCRYCQVGCPYDIPKFEWDDWYPEIVKCQLCDHLLEIGELPGCCSTCPTGASLFGPVSKLGDEASKRLQLEEGERYTYPVFSTESGYTLKHKAAKYIKHHYGDRELGGTQVTYLSAVPFKKLGLPEYPDKSYASASNAKQIGVYSSMLIPAAILGTYSFFIRKNIIEEKKEEEKLQELKENGDKDA